LIRKVLFLLAVVFLGAVGCQSDTVVQPTGGDILLWHSWNESDALVLQRMLNQFREIYPEADIVTTALPESELLTRFQETSALGLGPDIVIGSEEWLRPLAMARLIRPIPAPNPNPFDPNAISAMSYEGQLYSLPFALYTNVLYYNKQTVQNNPATSFLDFFRQAETGCQSKTEEPTPSAEIVADSTPLPTPTIVSEVVQISNEGCILAISTQFDEALWGIGVFGEGITDRNGNLRPYSEGFRGWLTWLQKAQLNPNIILSKDKVTLQQLFTSGVIDYYVADSADFPTLLNEMGSELLGVTLLPNSPAQMVRAEPSGISTPILRVEGFYFNYASSTEQFQLAQQLAHFLTNTTQSTVFMRQTRRVPANLLVNISPEVDQPQYIFWEQSQTAVPLPSNINRDTVRRIGETLYANVLTGIADPHTSACSFTQLVFATETIGTPLAQVNESCLGIGEADDE
jgi:ABC-type glycerol-3-phosphate transport system substrate-binding protein